MSRSNIGNSKNLSLEIYQIMIFYTMNEIKVMRMYINLHYDGQQLSKK
jgi:hypothetical protein